MYKLYLAPMEGVTDFIMRDLLTSPRGGNPSGIDQCTTEFLRVTDRLHPYSVFYKNCPELATGSRTLSGIPVYIQLLGGQAIPLAENAARAAELGALGIDLNFGCPAKTVNRHDGGATLLKYPDRIFNIVSTIRKTLPPTIPLTVKMRLGFEDTSLCLENAKAAELGGAERLTVHCRTKKQGYQPPAHWHWIIPIQEALKIPVVANGDISNLIDFENCLKMTDSSEFMIGRGALSNPNIFQQIKDHSKINQRPQNYGSAWNTIKPMLPIFFSNCERHINIHFATSRTKQWLKMLSSKNPESHEFFQQIKTLKTTEFKTKLDSLCL